MTTEALELDAHKKLGLWALVLDHMIARADGIDRDIVDSAIPEGVNTGQAMAAVIALKWKFTGALVEGLKFDAADVRKLSHEAGAAAEHMDIALPLYERLYERLVASQP
jgi:hypothetical protein